VESTGKILLLIGFVLLIAGGLFYLMGRLGIGSVPGDLSFRRGNVRIFIPLGTSIFLSIVLTLLLNFLFRR
jgi:hypothetical protein